MIERTSPVGTAKFSDDEAHRYVLTRGPLPIDPDGAIVGPSRFVVIGLNPSTADEVEPDNTIKRVSSFAAREGCTSLVMLNLWSLRSRDPRPLVFDRDRLRWPETDEVIREELARQSAIVVCAWGALDRRLPPDRVRRVIGLILDAGHRPYCFGTTKQGHPKHPLYLRKDTPIVPFDTR
jgi:hypothetical protein